jgi:hypothetical protein
VNQFATIRRIAEAVVPLGLWRVTPVHVGRLDGFEGVAIGSYERIRIRLPDGEEAWTYVERRHRPGPPSAKYVGHLRKGYRDFGLDPSPLEAALAESGLA